MREYRVEFLYVILVLQRLASFFVCGSREKPTLLNFVITRLLRMRVIWESVAVANTVLKVCNSG